MFVCSFKPSDNRDGEYNADLAAPFHSLSNVGCRSVLKCTTKEEFLLKTVAAHNYMNMSEVNLKSLQ